MSNHESSSQNFSKTVKVDNHEFLVELRVTPLEPGGS